MHRVRLGLLLTLLGLSLSLIPEICQAATLLFFESEPGDFVGAGTTEFFTPDDGNILALRNFDNGVSFQFNGDGLNFWTLDLAAPLDAILLPGSFEDAQRFPFQPPTSPGLSFDGAGRGCNTLTGRFDVLEALYALDGAVSKFAVNFEQHCEGAAPALFGEVRWNSDIPISPILVPSPVSLWLLASGLAGLAMIARIRHQLT